MKCFCCGKELVEANMLWCNDCGLTVDHKTKKATVMLRTKSHYVFDSFNVVEAICKYKPDVVTAKHQLFDKEFNINDVLFYYKDKRNRLSYEIPESLIKGSNIVRNNYTDYVKQKQTIIAINGILSYKFQRMLEINCMLLGSWNGVPMLSLYNIDPLRYMWQLSGNLSIDIMATDPVLTFVDIVTRYRLTEDTSTKDDELALIAYSTNGVAEFLRSKVFTVSNASDSVSYLRDAVRDAVAKASDKDWYYISNDKLIDSAIELYCNTKPCTAQVKGVAFNPLCKDYMSIVSKRVLNHNPFRVTNWWKFLSCLYSKYDYPGTVSSMEELRDAYTKWSRK